MKIPRGRRIALALVSLVLAGLLFRGSLGAALMSRGDELLAGGDLDGAVRIYARAAKFDPTPQAADRLAFVLLVRRRPGDAAQARQVASEGLTAAPSDAALLVDLGLSARRLGAWREAETAFLAAALGARDPRYAHFAAQMARRAGDRAGERGHLRTALRIDGSYQPARALLARLAS